FRRMKVYFIQCDCLIQDVAMIRNREDWLAYERKSASVGGAARTLRRCSTTWKSSGSGRN
ncbi:MAG: hypothetical protein ACLS4A_12890, partial [Oscillospiraceae bacterium]